MDNIKTHLYSNKNKTIITEIKNKKDDELQKLQNVINQLKNSLYVKHDSFSINNISQYSIRSKSQGKSFNRRSISQTKEDKNDKDFFCDLLYNDDIGILDYNNIHLLSEEEKHENITNNEKFKNLADLMMMIEDDDNIAEKKFIKEKNNNFNEDKIILNLYSTLGRKSKDLFLEENYEKRKKLQSYFRTINDIKLLRIDNKKYIFDCLKPKNKINNNNIDYNNNVNDKEDENDLGEDEICDFMNNSNVPEFSADFLSYINHGFVDIEDIYNINYNIKELNNENNEKKIIPKEVIEVNVSNDKEQIKLEKINKFIEFNDKCPKEININIKKDKKFIEQMERNKIFQNEIYKRMSDISEYDENLFPIKGNNIENKHIYFFAKNNKLNEITKEESFILERKKIDKNKNLIDNNINNDLKEEEEFELNENKINIEGNIDDNFDEEFFSIEEKNKFKNDNNIDYEEEHSSNIEMRNYKINKIYS